MAHDLPVGIQNGHPSLQFGNCGDLLAVGHGPERDGARSLESLHGHIHEFAVQIESLQPSVLTVADNQHRLLAGGIHPQAMTGLEGSILPARATKALDV